MLGNGMAWISDDMSRDVMTRKGIEQLGNSNA
nr:MAG TPA: hypothetical protein [Caudoviricetes sp.]